ncbi:MAG: DUF4139 domain-containing protein [Chitinophagaceae bacterium]|nr:DUF4139 domain-containing protein [Chitinophagaceae bacterium]
MKKLFLLFTFIVLVDLSFAGPLEGPVTSNAVLNNVTVFRSGAELNHSANASLKTGSNELLIEGLSSYLNVNSIQVNCPSAVTILGVEFSNNYLGEEAMSPVVKKLKDSAESISKEIARNNVFILTTNDLLGILSNNKEIKGANVNLSVAELDRLVKFYEVKSVELQNKLLLYNEKKIKLQLNLNKINSQIQEEQKKNTKSGGRLILQLFAAMPGNFGFKISYVTQNAYWVPYYDIKAENIKSPLKFIYKAKISQSTGIDWKKVKMSISTASPSAFGNAPVLNTWFLGFIDPIHTMNMNLKKQNSIQSFYADDTKSLSEVVVTSAVKVRGVSSVSGSSEPLYIVNGSFVSKEDFSKISPQAIKSTEVLKRENATAIYGSVATNGAVVVTLKEGLEDFITVSESELDLSYDIDIPFDVPTNGKEQIASLKEMEVPASYKYYAVPKLSRDAFLLAEVANWQTLNLLPGEANIIFEGTYIGKSFIDPSSTSDTLNLTLGVDKRVVIKKEKLVDFSSVKFIGTNKVQTMLYEISVKNNKKETIQLILKDQFPISTNKDIEVQQTESSGGDINKETAVVTWKLSIASGQSEKKRIGYSVKFPKGKRVNL